MLQLWKKRHIARDCKSKGKGYEGKEGKGKGKGKGYSKGWEDWSTGKGWSGWGKAKGYGKGVYSVHDNYDEEHVSKTDDEDNEDENEDSWIRTEDDNCWRGIYSLQAPPIIKTFNSFQALEEREERSPHRLNRKQHKPKEKEECKAPEQSNDNDNNYKIKDKTREEQTLDDVSMSLPTENEGAMFWQSVEELEQFKLNRQIRKETREERMRKQGQEAFDNIALAKMYANKAQTACGKTCMHGCVEVNIEELVKANKKQGDAKKERKESRQVERASLNILSSQALETGGREVYSVSKANSRTIWKKVEAAVDSGACDNVGNPRDFPGVDVKATEESKSDDPKINSWIGAGGDSITKLGEMKIPFVTDEGKRVRMRIKAGDVNKTLISVSRLQEAGFDTNLTKHPHLKNTRNGERINLTKKGGMFILTMWIKIGEETIQNKSTENEKDFHRQGK